MNAKSYRELARSKRANEPLHVVTLPSGTEWKLRTPRIEQFIAAGKLPASLAGKMAGMAKNAKGKEPDAAAKQQMAKSLTPEESLANLTFGRDLLLDCAVKPEICLNPDPDNEDQIAPEEILGEDFIFLINWVLTGGKTGESLTDFRAEPGEPVVAGTDGQALRAEAVQADWNS